MSTLRHGLQQTLCMRQLARSHLLKPQWQRPSFQIGVRNMSTTEIASQQNEPEIESNVTLPPEKPFTTVKKARPIPVSPSYFSREPRFNDNFIKVSALVQKWQHLPRAAPDEIPRQLWQTLEECRKALGEPVKAKPYAQFLTMIRQLHAIHPSVMPTEVKLALEKYRREVTKLVNAANPIPIDKFGRALGVGRRKTSTARAWVVEGTGEILINGKPIHEVFGRIHDRESVIWALRSTQRTDKYNVWALVEGGGVTGQAESLTLAIAKGLMAHEPDLKMALRKAGCLTRDSRAVERKKHGHVKARKMPAWVKR